MSITATTERTPNGIMTGPPESTTCHRLISSRAGGNVSCARADAAVSKVAKVAKAAGSNLTA